MLLNWAPVSQGRGGKLKLQGIQEFKNLVDTFCEEAMTRRVKECELFLFNNNSTKRRVVSTK